MANQELAEKLQYQRRYVAPAVPGDEDLGPLKLLPGVWKSEQQGWNMIALPFATDPPPQGFNFRVLMNQYGETLKFTLVDKGVPNRGIDGNVPGTTDTDQFLVTLDYEQSIHQIRVDDEPPSDKRGPECQPGGDNCLAIHHEPGLWLNMTNLNTKEIDIARLATIPHGNSVLALGTADSKKGGPEIPVLNGLPVGVSQDLSNPNNPYLPPYKKFEDEPFKGTAEGVPNFPGFFPTDMNAILRFANEGVDIARTTILDVDTTLEQAGIVNIPFIEKQADATEMKSTFWIQELVEKDSQGKPKLRLQYSQLVFLDFFEVPGGNGELIRWPHISINTMTKEEDGPVS
ncbi:MAG: heme-binding protein [Geminicoccaceae bacterium]